MAAGAPVEEREKEGTKYKTERREREGRKEGSEGILARRTLLVVAMLMVVGGDTGLQGVRTREREGGRGTGQGNEW